MLPRFIASQAWVERQDLSDKDLVWFGNPDANFAGAVPARNGDRCPQCGRQPTEPEFQVPVPDSVASTPERVTGRAYVGCLCRTLYYYTFVHDVSSDRPVGQFHVRAALTAPPVAPPQPAPAPPPVEPSKPRQHRMLDSHDIVMGNQRRNWHPAFDQTNVSAAVIWNEVEKERRRQQNEGKG